MGFKLLQKKIDIARKTSPEYVEKFQTSSLNRDKGLPSMSDDITVLLLG